MVRKQNENEWRLNANACGTEYSLLKPLLVRYPKDKILNWFAK